MRLFSLDKVVDQLTDRHGHLWSHAASIAKTYCILIVKCSDPKKTWKRSDWDVDVMELAAGKQDLSAVWTGRPSNLKPCEKQLQPSVVDPKLFHICMVGLLVYGPGFIQNLIWLWLHLTKPRNSRGGNQGCFSELQLSITEINRPKLKQILAILLSNNILSSMI